MCDLGFEGYTVRLNADYSNDDGDSITHKLTSQTTSSDFVNYARIAQLWGATMGAPDESLGEVDHITPSLVYRYISIKQDLAGVQVETGKRLVGCVMAHQVMLKNRWSKIADPIAFLGELNTFPYQEDDPT